MHLIRAGNGVKCEHGLFETRAVTISDLFNASENRNLLRSLIFQTMRLKLSQNPHKTLIKPSKLKWIMQPDFGIGDPMNLKHQVAHMAGALLLVFSALAFAVNDDDLNLIDAAGRDDATVFKTMLTLGANPDARDQGNNTAILLAAYHSNRSMVRQLIELHVDVNEKGSIGFTPLSAAAMRGDAVITDMLVKAGARINVHDDTGGTPLLNAIKFQQNENVKILLDAGADVNMTGALGETPMMVAAQLGRLDYTTDLLNKGANVNARGQQQVTALYYAIFEGHDDIAKLLIGAGADLKKPVNGYTPLHWAQAMAMTDIVPLMVKNGATE